ncbi:hypothetical protein D3C87_1910220 [compost metagenome]
MRGCAIGKHRIERQVEDLLLVGDMPVEAHDARTETVGETAHLQAVDTLGVQQFDRGRHDALQRQGRLAARLPPDRGCRLLHPWGAFALPAVPFDCHASTLLI